VGLRWNPAFELAVGLAVAGDVFKSRIEIGCGRGLAAIGGGRGYQGSLDRLSLGERVRAGGSKPVFT